MTNEPTLLLCLDLAGTFTFALNGGLTAVRAARLDIVGVVTLAMVSGLGGGIIRDVLLGQIPTVLHRGLYAIPALLAAGLTVAAIRAGIYGVPAALGAALACFAVRMLGVRYDLNAPMPLGLPREAPPEPAPPPDPADGPPSGAA